MLLRVALALALCACSSKKAEPPSRFAIVPDQVLNELGEFGAGLAIDLKGLDLDRLTSFIPEGLACTRDLLKSARMAVLTLAGDAWEGHVTGLDEAQTRDCLAKLAPALGVELQHEGSTYKLPLPGNTVELSWHGDEALFAQAGHAHRSGEPPVVIQDLLSHVPRTAKAWLVSSGFPDYKIDRATAYLETAPDTWTFTVTAEAIEQGAVRPWLEAIVGGFKTAAAAKGATVDDKWFVIDATPMKGKLVATIPLAALAGR